LKDGKAKPYQVKKVIIKHSLPLKKLKNRKYLPVIYKEINEKDGFVITF